MEDVKDKILEYFFEEPNKEFYVRELARLLKKSPTTISKYLLYLKREGLLTSSNKFIRLSKFLIFIASEIVFLKLFLASMGDFSLSI